MRNEEFNFSLLIFHLKKGIIPSIPNKDRRIERGQDHKRLRKRKYKEEFDPGSG